MPVKNWQNEVMEGKANRIGAACWPDGVTQEFDAHESYFPDVRATLGQDSKIIREAALCDGGYFDVDGWLIDPAASCRNGLCDLPAPGHKPPCDVFLDRTLSVRHTFFFRRI
jgi:hypothetical protein